MKKILICLIGTIILSNCNISCNVVEAGNPKFYENYSWEDTDINGMKYRIFYDDDGYYGGAIYVINLTKDALEVELLKKQLLKP